MFKKSILLILCLLVLTCGYNLSRQKVSALDKSKLSEEDIYFVGLTECLSSLDFKISDPILEKEKFDFFLIMCSLKEYTVESENYYNEETETYNIPIEYINKIVTEHLPCEPINTSLLSEQTDLFKKNYDKTSDTYATTMIGRYGDIKPTVVLDITKENNNIAVTLGELDKKEYSKNNVVLTSQYIAKFKVEDFKTAKYKILEISCE